MSPSEMTPPGGTIAGSGVKRRWKTQVRPAVRTPQSSGATEKYWVSTSARTSADFFEVYVTVTVAVLEPPTFVTSGNRISFGVTVRNAEEGWLGGGGSEVGGLVCGGVVGVTLAGGGVVGTAGTELVDEDGGVVGRGFRTVVEVTGAELEVGASVVVVPRAAAGTAAR